MAASDTATTRFSHLDGLRGLAALFVVVHHAYVEIAWTSPGLSSRAQSVCYLFTQGTLAVDVFIVLSGFVLMLPIIKSRELRGGLGGFIKRRERRILPPYYAALALSLLLIALIPALQKPAGDRWDAALPAFSFGSIASHVLLIHNLSREWIWKIDNPMWSVATEWQIYFLFALILLPVWKRLGMLAALCTAMTIGAVIEFFMPPETEACFHFVGLFAFGMYAAHVAARRRTTGRRDWMTDFICLLTVASIAAIPTLTRQPKIVVDLVVGAVTAFLIVRSIGSNAIAVRICSSRIARKLGEFSYSLYLVHFPIIACCAKSLRTFDLHPNVRLVLIVTAGTAISVGVSYTFHRCFERPFLTAPSSESTRQVVSQQPSRLAA